MSCHPPELDMEPTIGGSEDRTRPARWVIYIALIVLSGLVGASIADRTSWDVGLAFAVVVGFMMGTIRAAWRGK